MVEQSGNHFIKTKGLDSSKENSFGVQYLELNECRVYFFNGLSGSNLCTSRQDGYSVCVKTLCNI